MRVACRRLPASAGRTLERLDLTALCRAYLKDRHSIEVVNVFREPKRALADGILMTPTLVKLAPAPAPRKIVGTLSQTQPVLQALGLETLTVNP